MADLPPLTDRQQQVLAFIQDRIDDWGYPPTIREIGEHLGIRSTNGVADHLKALKRKGYLTQEGMKSRTLKPAVHAVREKGHSKGVPGAPARSGRTGSRYGPGDGTVPALVGRGEATVSIPVLGRVAAGEPILAEENAEGSVVVDSFLVGDGDKTFALKVVGESMIDDGIFDGDFIFVRKRSVASRGEIVVAMIEGEATVKRYFPEKNRIRFQPANTTMKPIYVRREEFRETQILGIVVGVYRRLPG
ncbi:MAG: transcriptional repressor LexA [Myxococcota bacterium]